MTQEFRLYPDPTTADTMLRIRLIEQRLDETNERIDRLHAGVEKTSTEVSEVLNILTNARGFFNVAGAIGTFIKWAAGTVAAILALWAVWNGHSK